MHWIDSFRIFPRIVLVLYIAALWVCLNWYLDFDIIYQKECDPSTLTLLLDRNIPLKDSRDIACTTTAAVGRPHGYTALMSVLVTAGAGIFGLYVNSGRTSRKEKE